MLRMTSFCIVDYATADVLLHITLWCMPYSILGVQITPKLTCPAMFYHRSPRMH
jgi:hypothetical protein